MTVVKALNERKPSMLRLRHRIEPASRYNAVGRVACLERVWRIVRSGVFRSANRKMLLLHETSFAKEAKID